MEGKERQRFLAAYFQLLLDTSQLMGSETCSTKDTLHMFQVLGEVSTLQRRLDPGATPTSRGNPQLDKFVSDVVGQLVRSVLSQARHQHPLQAVELCANALECMLICKGGSSVGTGQLVVPLLDYIDSQHHVWSVSPVTEPALFALCKALKEVSNTVSQSVR